MRRGVARPFPVEGVPALLLRLRALFGEHPLRDPLHAGRYG